jgi:hypothetical protein
MQIVPRLEVVKLRTVLMATNSETNLAGSLAFWEEQVRYRRPKGERLMAPKAWNAKRERQYEHVRDSLESRGSSEREAEEIAARTVNKERARAGESKTSSRSSTRDISSGRRGGLRSHRGPGGPTYEQLYNEARQRNIKGRSWMNKSQLARALGR